MPRFAALAMFMLGVLIAALLFGFPLFESNAPDPAYVGACAGEPLRTVEARNDAMEKGYAINRRYDCIDRASYEAIERQEAARLQAANAAPRPTVESPAASPLAQTLAQARSGFRTQISQSTDQPLPLPEPPAELFVRSDYLNRDQRLLPAYLSSAPNDGQKHPAIIWLTGGDSNSLGDFWTPGPEANDQSASAFRKAGVVMMFPTLRGGNVDDGGKEFYFGEVEDVLAAADHLARQPYVDAAHIYLGGHSTGGTLALLTAETDGRFRAVFAFGPVAELDSYPPSLIPVDFSRYDLQELELRSPIHWLGGIAAPTYVIEGVEQPSNIDELDRLCRRTDNPMLSCIRVRGADHFSVLSTVSRVIAARVAVSTSGVPFALRAEEFQ